VRTGPRVSVQLHPDHPPWSWWLGSSSLQGGPDGTTLSGTTARQASPAPNGSFDRDYWLGHCEGYRVDGVEGRIGFVDAVRVQRGAAVLAVRAGRLGRRILLVPAEEVVFIVPRAGRLWLQTPATIIDSEAAEGRVAA